MPPASTKSAASTAAPRRPASRARRRKGASVCYRRINWVRTLALASGVLVLLAHIFTTRTVGTWLDWLHIDWPDMAKHSLMLASFALAYRLSWRTDARPGAALVAPWLGPGVATVIICGGWGAVCETLQHWIPSRDFAPFELLVNVSAPALIAGLVELSRRAWLSLQHQP